jgi:hypothetical protein
MALSIPALAGPPSYRSGTDLWVAAAAHSPGSNNANWVTDVWIAAPTAAAEVDVRFLAAGLGAELSARNLAAAPIRVTVPAGGQVYLPDIVASRFGVTTGSGALRFVSTGNPAPAILVTSRTYNTAATGTYGQFIPAIPAELAFGPSDGTARTAQQSIGLRESSDYRSNVGIVNVSATDPATVRIELRARSGELLGALTETFQPWNAYQFVRIMNQFGIDPTDDSRIVIRVVEGTGRVLSYASIVDNRTQDPVYLPGTNGQ